MTVPNDQQTLRSPIRFADNFWSKDDSSLNILVNKLYYSKQTCEDLKRIFTTRAQIEEDYAEKLLKLSQQPLGRNEIGTLALSIKDVSEAVETTGRAHLELAQRLKKHLEQPLESFILEQRDESKAAKSEIETSVKLKHFHTANALRAQEYYKSLVNKFIQLQESNTQNPNSQENEAEVEMLKVDIRTADLEYQSATRSLAQVTSQFQDNWIRACDTFQTLEERRINFLRNHLWALANMLSDVYVIDDQSCEKVRVSLENCDAQPDIEEFVREKGTSRIPPESVKYENLHAGLVTPAPSRFISDFNSGKFTPAPQSPPRNASSLPYNPSLSTPPLLPPKPSGPQQPPNITRQASLPYQPPLVDSATDGSNVNPPQVDGDTYRSFGSLKRNSEIRIPPALGTAGLVGDDKRERAKEAALENAERKDESNLSTKSPLFEQDALDALDGRDNGILSASPNMLPQQISIPDAPAPHNLSIEEPSISPSSPSGSSMKSNDRIMAAFDDVQATLDSVSPTKNQFASSDIIKPKANSQTEQPNGWIKTRASKMVDSNEPVSPTTRLHQDIMAAVDTSIESPIIELPSKSRTTEDLSIQPAGARNANRNYFGIDDEEDEEEEEEEKKQVIQGEEEKKPESQFANEPQHMALKTRLTDKQLAEAISVEDTFAKPKEESDKDGGTWKMASKSSLPTSAAAVVVPVTTSLIGHTRQNSDGPPPPPPPKDSTYSRKEMLRASRPGSPKSIPTSQTQQPPLNVLAIEDELSPPRQPFKDLANVEDISPRSTPILQARPQSTKSLVAETTILPVQTSKPEPFVPPEPFKDDTKPSSRKFFGLFGKHSNKSHENISSSSRPSIDSPRASMDGLNKNIDAPKQSLDSYNYNDDEPLEEPKFLQQRRMSMPAVNGAIQKSEDIGDRPLGSGTRRSIDTGRSFSDSALIEQPSLELNLDTGESFSEALGLHFSEPKSKGQAEQDLSTKPILPKVEGYHLPSETDTLVTSPEAKSPVDGLLRKDKKKDMAGPNEDETQKVAREVLDNRDTTKPSYSNKIEVGENGSGKHEVDEQAVIERGDSSSTLESYHPEPPTGTSTPKPTKPKPATGLKRAPTIDAALTFISPHLMKQSLPSLSEKSPPSSPTANGPPQKFPTTIAPVPISAEMEPPTNTIQQPYQMAKTPPWAYGRLPVQSDNTRPGGEGSYYASYRSGQTPMQMHAYPGTNSPQGHAGPRSPTSPLSQSQHQQTQQQFQQQPSPQQLQQQQQQNYHNQQQQNPSGADAAELARLGVGPTGLKRGPSVNGPRAPPGKGQTGQQLQPIPQEQQVSPRRSMSDNGSVNSLKNTNAGIASKMKNIMMKKPKKKDEQKDEEKARSKSKQQSQQQQQQQPLQVPQQASRPTSAPPPTKDGNKKENSRFSLVLGGKQQPPKSDPQQYPMPQQSLSTAAQNGYPMPVYDTMVSSPQTPAPATSFQNQMNYKSNGNGGIPHQYNQQQMPPNGQQRMVYDSNIPEIELPPSQSSGYVQRNGRMPPPGNQQTAQSGPMNKRTTMDDGTPIIGFVRALWDYTAQIAEELSFNENDILVVLRKQDDGWWEGEVMNKSKAGQRGLFPSNFIEELPA